MCIIRHMKHRTRYTNAKVSRSRALAMRRKFLKDAGPAMKLMIELMESLPNVAFVLKNAEGRIMHMNKYNMIMSGWRTLDEVLGYHSEELYPPDQAAVYAGRDREVMESGKPIIERVYGFVADRSTNLNCVTVRPVNAPNGRRIGTATVCSENVLLRFSCRMTDFARKQQRRNLRFKSEVLDHVCQRSRGGIFPEWFRWRRGKSV